MILEFNDTPEGLVVDVEMVSLNFLLVARGTRDMGWGVARTAPSDSPTGRCVCLAAAFHTDILTNKYAMCLLPLQIAGLPYKGYDERSPLRGYFTAAGLNEMAVAPAFAGKGPAFDWNEAFDAITRHVVEEFTNLQFFVPYFWQKYTALGKAGINWIPTLGTWMQNNKISLNDEGRSISFYHALVALSNSLINKNGTVVASAVDALAAATNATFQAKTAAATAAVVAKSQVYVQPSNAVTAATYEYNKNNGAHPEAANTYGIFKGNQSVGVSVGHNGTKPLEGLQNFIKSKLLHPMANTSTDEGGKRINFRFGFAKGFNHTFGK